MWIDRLKKGNWFDSTKANWNTQQYDRNEAKQEVVWINLLRVDVAPSSNIVNINVMSWKNIDLRWSKKRQSTRGLPTLKKIQFNSTLESLLETDMNAPQKHFTINVKQRGDWRGSTWTRCYIRAYGGQGGQISSTMVLRNLWMTPKLAPITNAFYISFSGRSEWICGGFCNHHYNDWSLFLFLSHLQKETKAQWNSSFKINFNFLIAVSNL